MCSKLLQSRLIYLVLTILLIGFIPDTGFAWGSSGHRIIARVATHYLNRRAQDEVRRLLAGEKEDVIAASTWADEIRFSRPETSNWHFVDFPRNATAYVPSRDCLATGQGECMVSAVQRFIRVLKNPKYGDEEKREALKFLIHLVGDLHQPLHCGYKDDRGGNIIRVYFTRSVITNLHSAWDSGMIARAMAEYGGDESKYETYLNKTYDKFANDVVRSTKGDQDWISEWAFESYCIAVRSAYNLKMSKLEAPCQMALGMSFLPFQGLGQGRHHATPGFSVQKTSRSLPVDISGAYYKANLPVLERQLVKGGIRLALILNEIYPEK